MPPVATLPEIIEQLRTNWGGGDQGQHRDWSDHRTVTYSFPHVVNDGPFYSEGDGLRPMYTVQEDAARLAFELWDDVIAIDLTETSRPDGEIIFAHSSSTEDNGTYARTIEEDFGTNLHEAEVWISTTDAATDGLSEDFYFGSFGFFTYVHEIGHALGLTHPGRYNSGDGDPDTYAMDALYAQDTQRYSVMSYFSADADGSRTDHRGSDGAWSYAATPLLHDIAAMQAIYGADMTTRTGDTVYGFNTNAGRTFDRIPPFYNNPFDFAQNPNPVLAIWDAGGIDTIDASGFATDQTIRLGEGEFSSVGALTNNIAIAFGARIENAIGGSGNDTMSGNAWNNRLDGGGGNDNLIAGSGTDTLIGGAGRDTLWGAGSDNLWGGTENDVYYVTIGDRVVESEGGGVDTVETELATYTLTPNVENLVFTNAEFDPTGAHRGTGNPLGNTMTGAGGSDTLHGQDGQDILWGRAGDDTLNGGNHNDTLHGEAGVDTVNGEQGDDTLYGGPDNDTLDGGIGADRLEGGIGIDTLRGGSQNDHLFGGSENDSLNGQADQDVLVGGAGRDTLTGGSGADTFRFVDASFDTITDFEHGVDRLDVSMIDANGSLLDGDQAFTFLPNAAKYMGSWVGLLWVSGGTSSGFTPGGFPGGGPGFPLTPTTVYGSTDADPEAEFQISLHLNPAVTASDFIL
jgi:Ca2+-binding RTX toxin-like protein